MEHAPRPTRGYMAPLQGWLAWGWSPRASPWAMLYCPVGAGRVFRGQALKGRAIIALGNAQGTLCHRAIQALKERNNTMPLKQSRTKNHSLYYRQGRKPQQVSCLATQSHDGHRLAAVNSRFDSGRLFPGRQHSISFPRTTSGCLHAGLSPEQVTEEIFPPVLGLGGMNTNRSALDVK